MLALLSPAKTLNLSPWQHDLDCTEPAMMQDAQALMRTTRGLTQKKIRELMHVSPTLAKLNQQRFNSFQLPFSAANAHPAALIFAGPVYQALDARGLSIDDLEWAQSRIAILSGLFGMLRPLDWIQPYRLEMGTALKTRRGSNLYQFWGERIAACIEQVMAGHSDQTIVNLASAEYFRSVRHQRLTQPVVECVFEDWKTRPDEGRVMGFLAKRARGLMARYIITERIDRVEGLKEFKAERYCFQASRSGHARWVFSRRFVAAGAARRAPVPA